MGGGGAALRVACPGDADCDEIPEAEDCDDGDVDLGPVADDADCDGAVGDGDCDDEDPRYWDACPGDVLEAFAITSPDGVELGTGAGQPDGGVVLCGNFAGTVTLGEQEGEQVQRSTAGGGERDGFVVRYGADGDVAWVKQFRSPGDTALRMAMADDGSFVVVGGYNNDVTLLDDEGHEAPLQGDSGGDLILVRYTAGGVLQWIRNEANPAHELTGSIAIAADGSAIAIAGRIQGAGHIFGQGGNRQVTVDGVGGVYDGYLAVYDANGHLRWARGGGGAADQDGFGTVAIAPDGRVYAVAWHEGDANFGGGALDHRGEGDSALMRFDVDGAPMWSRRVAGSGPDAIGGLAVDADSGVYAVGTFRSQTQFEGLDPEQVAGSAQQGFVAHYLSSGQVRWVTQIGGVENDSADAVSLLEDGPVVTGWLRGPVPLDVDGRIVELTAVDVTEPYVIQVDTDGDVIWATVPADGPREDRPRAIQPLSDGSDLLLLGLVRDDLVVRRGEEGEQTLSAPGADGGFVLTLQGPP